MARSTGYALLAALAALVALAAIGSAAIFAGAGGSDATADVGSPVVRSSASAAPAASGTWVGTWSTAATGGEPRTGRGYPGMSIRNVVHSSVSGTAARVTLSNAFGTRPLVISRTTVAVAADAGSPAAKAGTMRTLTFGGSATVAIAAGATAVSDSVQLTVPETTDLLVTTYSPIASGPVTYHPHARELSYTARGEHTAQSSGRSFTGQSPYWRYVTAVDVFTRQAAGAVVVLGDSITDGVTSTVGANHRWPDRLAARLLASRDKKLHMGVLNEGISGNRLLRDGGVQLNPSALSRLDRDVLARTGAKVLVVDLGINDILKAHGRIDPGVIEAGLRQIVRRAHEHRMRVVGATLLPLEGHYGYSATAESVRRQVNAGIRSGGVFDAVIDFDKALRDPSRPTRMLPVYDSGDHLHPSDAGFQAMADAVTPGTLKVSTVSTA